MSVFLGALALRLLSYRYQAEKNKDQRRQAREAVLS